MSPPVVRVVPLAPVEGAYSYRVPDALAAGAVPGARVVVPFGGRSLTGVVVEAGDESDGEALRDVVAVLDGEEPSFSAELLALTRWTAGYYGCAWGEVLRAALPAGAEVESRRVVARAERPATEWAGPASGRALLAHLDGGDGGLFAVGPKPEPIAAEGIEAAVGRAVPDAVLRRLAAEGFVRIEASVSGTKVQARTERFVRRVNGNDADAVRGAKQRAVLDALSNGEIRMADLLRTADAASATVAGLARLGLVEITERETHRAPDEARGDAQQTLAAPTLALHPAQTRALDAITGALAEGRAETFLLHGVTGSGKTEVYLRALRAALDAGKTGIVLVPEIALTPQTVRRFRAHFGDRVAVLHSRMSPGERFDAWRALRAGRFSIAIGPRSAVFAPLDNLGLLVVDEEHEASYKQFDPAPRYHARDVAVVRARLAGAVCVLGSATPALESVVNARAGKYRLLEMSDRVPVAGGEAAPLPAVHLVDLAREKETRRLKGALSLALRDALALRLERGEQAILLQNRRGYSPVLSCDDCGHAPRCPDCAVSLTVHKAHRQLRCHYCGRAERIPARCPSCNSTALTLLGAGTQRVEEELAEVFPAARVLRMDLDTTTKKGAHRRLLDAFGRGEADILLGTQMVAKGLDFPRVTLVGVVNADTGMLLPDFRAAERAFQLLAQVAGRAGRHDLIGEVFLQTRNPDHPAIRFALTHDFEGFAEAELDERRALGYPPFGRLVGVEFKGPEEATVEALALDWTNALRAEVAASGLDGVEVLGPAEAFVGRVKKLWRQHTLLKASRTVPPARLVALVRGAGARAGAAPAGHRVNVDVDPVGLF